MSEALASGEPLPEIDNNDLGGDADVVVVVMMMVVMMITMVKTTMCWWRKRLPAEKFYSNDLGQV